jgi:hypothetical protein
MRTYKANFAAYILLICPLVLSGDAASQTRQPRRPPPRQAPSAGAEATKPADLGPAHKRMAALIGNYDTVTKIRMQPGSQVMESSGSAMIKGGIEGRFLMEENSGTTFGEPSNGMRLIGYNNGTHQYESVWVYTGSTAILSFTGKSEDDGKTIDWTGTYNDENGEKQTLTAITRVIDGDHFVLELHATSPEGPVLETTYIRKAARPARK